MGLTTERKVFLALALIAGASLVVDQAILSPKSASASGLDATNIDLIPDDPILAGITKPITKSVTEILNERLGSLDSSKDLKVQPDSIQSMFAPLIKPTPEPAANTKLNNLPQTVVAQEPSQQIPTNLPNLSAVMPSRTGQSGAILDATLYRVGDTTPTGYTLLTVEQRKVLVDYQGRKFWLTLPAFKD